MYADDLNVVSVFSPSGEARENLERASSAIRDWYITNGLMLNAEKTEILLVGTAAHVRGLHPPVSVSIAGRALPAGEKMTLLDVKLELDSGLKIDSFVNSNIHNINFHLRARRSFDRASALRWPRQSDELCPSLG